MTQNPHKIFLICGRKRSGKTVFASKFLKANNKKTPLVYQSPHDSTFNFLPLVTRPEKWLNTPARTSELFIEYEDFLQMAYRAKNSIIIFDDFTGYEDSRISLDFKRVISRNRHNGNTILIITHSLSDTPKKIFNFIDGVILFKTKENMIGNINRLPDFTELSAAHNRLKNAPDFAPEFVKI